MEFCDALNGETIAQRIENGIFLFFFFFWGGKHMIGHN
jgi:hypothetical protein